MKAEAEEIIEAKLIAAIALAVQGIPIDGLLSPAPDGVAKFASGTAISVVVDREAQGLDVRGPNVSGSWAAAVAVRVAHSEDKTGLLFRNACRAVHAALLEFTGDCCYLLDGDGFACDGFTLGATQTTLDDSVEGGATRKTYPVAIAGRYNTETETEAN